MPQIEVSVVIPTYNEREGLESLVDRVCAQFREAGVQGQVVIVDDNSPDGTGDLAESLKSRYPVMVVHRAGKLGLSSAVVEGFRAAEGDILGVMDADGSHDVAVIPALIRAIRDDGNELAVGSRYIRGGGIRDWPLHRVIISRVAVLMATPLTRVKDITSGFFFFQRRIIDGVHLNPIGFKIGLEVFVKARYSRFCEVPYTFTDRVQGKSKLSGKVIWQYLLQLCNLIAYRISTLCCRC